MLKDNISGARSIYFLPKDDVVKEALIPAFKSSSHVRILMGYFSSASFRQIADGLATFLNENDGTLEIIISPYVTNQDRSIILMDDDERQSYVENSMFSVEKGKDSIENHCLACFGWLLSENRLDLKIALVSDGLFHMKAWLFDDGEDAVVLHGSMNQTERGMNRNFEQVKFVRPWVHQEARDEVEYFKDYFDALIDGQIGGVRLFELSMAAKQNLILKYKDSQSRPNEPASITGSTDEPLAERKRLKIPSYVNYETGDFVHQGQALNCWLNSEKNGILNMATGSGKTITSLICAYHVQETFDKIMLFISAPQRPLMMQWIDEVSEFGVSSENISEMNGWDARYKAIVKADRLLKFGSIDAAVFVISNDLLKSKKFLDILENTTSPKMLIGDECHNFGKDSLSEGLRNSFSAKLGLSATPVRQYDEEGSEFLENFFGKVCFNFTLEDAIGKCLTPYDYYVKPVYFDHNEMDNFIDLTAQIGKLSWQAETSDTSSLDHLKRQRRKLIETASMKIPTLRGVLSDEVSQLEHALIYCTDKDPEQLTEVNEMLNSIEVLFRQVTSLETSRIKDVSRILKSFRMGETKVLTAKRVLDEGVNIPETKRAYVLASNTVERQWTQRRGRILRKCKAVGKEFAEIYDFVVLPFDALSKTPDELGTFDKKLIELELPRIREFSRLSRNKFQSDGAQNLIEKMNELVSS